MRCLALAAGALTAAVLAGPVLAGEGVSEPAGYRMQDYQAPTPQTLAGAEVLDVEAAARLWREKKAIFVDVLPRPPRPANLPAGTIWRDPPRKDIPDSVWLPNVGFGALSAEMEDYFRRNLSALAAEARGRPLVFYCRAECWMSWNAAKRAIAWGFRPVAWFPQGTDGWGQAGLPLAP